MLVTSHWTDHRTRRVAGRKSDIRKSGLRRCKRREVEWISDVPIVNSFLFLLFFAVARSRRSLTAYLNPSDATEGESRPKSNLISLGLPRYLRGGASCIECERGTKATRLSTKIFLRREREREGRKRKAIHTQRPGCPLDICQALMLFGKLLAMLAVGRSMRFREGTIGRPVAP